MVNIYYGIPKKDVQIDLSEKYKNIQGTIVLPGDLISDSSGYMRGHGTYMGKSQNLFSSVLGEVNCVNKLIQVQPKYTKYLGHVGDLIIGRVTEVGLKRWKIEANTKRDSYLLLSAINLPGGELRRRSLEDEIHMRDLLQEGDLITAEVQIVHKDGSLSLQTRNLNYGKLDDDGIFIRVPPYLIKRSRNHFLKFQTLGLNLCLGNNGYIWISATIDSNNLTNTALSTDSGKLSNNKSCNQESTNVTSTEGIDIELYERMVRLRNVIISMALHAIMIHEESILVCYECSLYYEPKTLLNADISDKFISAARRKKENALAISSNQQ